MLPGNVKNATIDRHLTARKKGFWAGTTDIHYSFSRKQSF